MYTSIRLFTYFFHSYHSLHSLFSLSHQRIKCEPVLVSPGVVSYPIPGISDFLLYRATLFPSSPSETSEKPLVVPPLPVPRLAVFLGAPCKVTAELPEGSAPLVPSGLSEMITQNGTSIIVAPSVTLTLYRIPQDAAQPSHGVTSLFICSQKV